MNITQVIDSIDVDTGGPARSITNLVSAMAVAHPSIRNEIFTLNSENPIMTHLDKRDIKFFNKGIAGSSARMKMALEVSNSDVYHGHGLWQLPVHYMAKVARKNGIPYIITPRGMLEPWPLTQSKLKKQIALKFYQYKDLQECSCIHATALSEAKNIRKLGLKTPIAVIPNGINLDEFSYKKKIQPLEKKILFLSRIHKKKGIEMLVKAWANLDLKLKNNWRIDIVGNGEEKYIESLKKLIADYDCQDTIKIIGPVFGSEKLKVYNEADLFVLPSYSENFGIVVAEALACGLPVITTTAAPWSEINSHNCGLWIEPTVPALTDALNKLMNQPMGDLQEMGRRGRKLVEKEYSIASVGYKMGMLYNWLLKNTDKPDFVLLK